MFFRILSRLLCVKSTGSTGYCVCCRPNTYVIHVRPVLRFPDPKSKRFNLLPFGNACCGIHRPRHHPLSITSLHCRVCIYIYIQLEISVFLKFTMKIILALIATATTASAFVPAVSQNGVPQCTSVLPVVMRIVELE